jgi:phospholipid transport system substrate-binding protein
VETKVEQQAGQPVQILYYLHESAGQWLVYDVVVEDLSLVTNYRASFSNEIRAAGVDGLISKLKARNKELGG